MDTCSVHLLMLLVEAMYVFAGHFMFLALFLTAAAVLFSGTTQLVIDKLVNFQGSQQPAKRPATFSIEPPSFPGKRGR